MYKLGIAVQITLDTMNTRNEALEDIDRAFKLLEFSIKLLFYVENDHIDSAVFDQEATLLFEAENLCFSSGTFQASDSLALVAQENVGVAFGVSAIVLHAAFEVVGLVRRPASNEPEDLLHTLVFMVRSAFAHNPAFPCWEARGPYQRTLSIQLEGHELSINLSQLHAVPFEYKHIGGLANWFRIRRQSEELLHGA